MINLIKMYCQVLVEHKKSLGWLLAAQLGLVFLTVLQFFSLVEVGEQSASLAKLFYFSLGGIASRLYGFHMIRVLCISLGPFFVIYLVRESQEMIRHYFVGRVRRMGYLRLSGLVSSGIFHMIISALWIGLLFGISSLKNWSAAGKFFFIGGSQWVPYVLLITWLHMTVGLYLLSVLFEGSMKYFSQPIVGFMVFVIGVVFSVGVSTFLPAISYLLPGMYPLIDRSKAVLEYHIIGQLITSSMLTWLVVRK